MSDKEFHMSTISISEVWVCEMCLSYIVENGKKCNWKKLKLMNLTCYCIYIGTI